jgi:hypothetical protein
MKAATPRAVAATSGSDRSNGMGFSPVRSESECNFTLQQKLPLSNRLGTA